MAAVAVASMPSPHHLATPPTPLNATQFPDHANWADASAIEGVREDIKMEENEENAECGEGSASNSRNSSSGHNSQQTDSDSDIASSRPPSPPLAESTKEEPNEEDAVKQEFKSEDTLDRALEASSTSQVASERSSWLAETQLPKREGKFSFSDTLSGNMLNLLRRFSIRRGTQ